LGRAGFLATRRGIGGGFTLAQPPAKIGLGDVVRLTEADESVIDCKDRRNQPCRIFSVCHLKGVLGEAGAAFFAVLDRYSLEDLVKQKADLRNLLKL
jgi:Rrf2 family nitric oxide-sensitive transcriptional repressor